MGNSAIRIGLVGCGRVAENHAEAIAKCSGAVLSAAAGGRCAAAFGEKHGVPVLPAEEICNSGLIDALLVLTPLAVHREYTVAALCAGKHVLVEKPVSAVPEDIAEMRRAAREAGRVCMPGHSYLYLPELARMARVIPAGGIGVPTYLYMGETYYMPPGLFEKYEGPHIDVLCHQLYMSLVFLGVPKKLYACRTSFSKNVIETGGPQVALTMEYAGGAIAQVLVSWAVDDGTSDSWSFKVKALGTGGGMHFSRRDYVQKGPDGSFEPALYQEMFDRQMDFFVHRCILGSEAPLSTIAEAETVCRLHALVLRSIETGASVETAL